MSNPPGPTKKAIVSSAARKAVENLFRIAAGQDEFLKNIPAALDELARRGEDLPPALAEAMLSKEPHERMMAAWFLIALESGRPGFLDDPSLVDEAASVLVAGLTHREFKERLAACTMLSLGPVPSKAVRILRKLAEDKDEDERVRVLAAAAVIVDHPGSVELIRTLERGLRSPQPGIAGAAATAMARLGLDTPEPIKALLSAFEEADPGVKYHILTGFKRLGPAAAGAIDMLCRFIDDRKNQVTLRGHAASVLGHVAKGTDRGDATLTRALRSREAPVLTGAVEGFKHLGHFPPDAAARLAEDLSADDEELRIAAVRGIASLGAAAAPAVSALVARLGREPSKQMVDGLADAIAACGETAVPSIIEIIKQQDYTKVPVAALALLRMGAAGGQALARALEIETDPHVRGFMVLVARDLGPSAAAVVPIMDYLLAQEADDEEAAFYLLMAIHATGPAAAGAVAGILRCLLLGGDELAFYAERVLVTIGPQIADDLQYALSLADTDLKRERVSRVLARLGGSIGVAEDLAFSDLENLEIDKKLWTFVYVADVLLEAKHALGYGRISDKLQEKKAAGQIPNDFPISARMLALDIKKVEENLKAPLIDSIEGREGFLTDDARRKLPRIKAYLEAKAKRKRRDQSG